jgi:hypothetical protein
MSKSSTKHHEPEAAEALAPPPQAADTSRMTATEVAALQPAQTVMPERHLPPLALPRIVLTHASEGSIGNHWTALVPPQYTWEDCKSDWFWANKANIMKPGDQILVIHDTWDYFGRLLVQQTRVYGPGSVPNRVTVIEESFKQGAMPASQANLDGMYVKYMGVYPKWCIFDRSKAEPIRQGYASQAEAERERSNLANTRTEPRRPDAWHG